MGHSLYWSGLLWETEDQDRKSFGDGDAGAVLSLKALGVATHLGRPSGEGRSGLPNPLQEDNTTGALSSGESLAGKD